MPTLTDYEAIMPLYSGKNKLPVRGLIIAINKIAWFEYPSQQIS